MKVHQLQSFVSHWLNKVDEHSIHSPFFFDFYQHVIKASRKNGTLAEVEKLRTSLLANPTEISITDLGAGSTTNNGSKRKLSEIAEASLSPARLSRLYAAILAYYDARYAIELGTSMGLNTLYLSQKRDSRVFTFEGSPALSNIALTHFESLDKTNIKLIEGNIDSTLPNFLQQTDKVNFVLMDANHRYEPTLRYFQMLVRRLNENSVVVIDDIHWSVEMEKAWNELSHHTLVYGSIDLYRCGILFFDPALNRQHFILSL